MACRIRCWTIIGEAGTGKSPTVRALLSLSPEANRPPNVSQVLLRGGGYLNIRGKVSALQEAGWDQHRAEAEITQWSASNALQKPAISPAFFNVLLTLRFDAFRNKGIKGAPHCPPAEVYLAHFVDIGWELQPIVLMSPSPKHDVFSRFGVPTLWADESTSANQTNGAVRNHFGWA